MTEDPMDPYRKLAGEYGVDPANDDAVLQFFRTELHRMDSATRERLFLEILPEVSGRGSILRRAEKADSEASVNPWAQYLLEAADGEVDLRPWDDNIVRYMREAIMPHLLGIERLEVNQHVALDDIFASLNPEDEPERALRIVSWARHYQSLAVVDAFARCLSYADSVLSSTSDVVPGQRDSALALREAVLDHLRFLDSLLKDCARACSLRDRRRLHEETNNVLLHTSDVSQILALLSQAWRALTLHSRPRISFYIRPPSHSRILRVDGTATSNIKLCRIVDRRYLDATARGAIEKGRPSFGSSPKYEAVAVPIGFEREVAVVAAVRKEGIRYGFDDRSLRHWMDFVERMGVAIAKTIFAALWAQRCSSGGDDEGEATDRRDLGRGKTADNVEPTAAGSSVFIVHGHDEAAKEAVARLIVQLQLTPVLLSEQPDQGRTVIEKFEQYAGVSYAIVLLTPDDVGALCGSADSKPRARQNVIFELGFFVGSLGRGNVCVLHKGGVEIASDYRGVLYIEMDDARAWRTRLAKELKNAGLSVDLNRL